MEKITNWVLVPTEQVVINQDNPRAIKDEKFKKLVQSIKDFPEMLNLRPIVVDENMVVIGGNMRLHACRNIGIKEVPVIIAKGLTEEQKREFLIKDNASFGEWDFEVLANEWEPDLLKDWGIDIPLFQPKFEPNLEPSSSQGEVEREDMEKAENEMGAPIPAKAQKVECTCPECGHDFVIQL